MRSSIKKLMSKKYFLDSNVKKCLLDSDFFEKSDIVIENQFQIYIYPSRFINFRKMFFPEHFLFDTYSKYKLQ